MLCCDCRNSSQAGLGSRRSCEQFIKDNRVSVNGKVAALGTKVSENDEVTLDGNRVLPKAADLKVIMLNKPVFSHQKKMIRRLSSYLIFCQRSSMNQIG